MIEQHSQILMNSITRGRTQYKSPPSDQSRFCTVSIKPFSCATLYESHQNASNAVIENLPPDVSTRSCKGLKRE